MADYTKAVSFEGPKDDIKVTNLKDNPFVDEKTGKLYLPSLYTQEEVDKFLNDKDFKIHRTFFRKKYGSLQQSVAHMYTYAIADDFNYVMSQLSDEDLYWLKFIGRFKSIQTLQIYRQTALFSENFSRKRAEESLEKLYKYELIWKWSFKRDFIDKPLYTYTLTVNGFRFLEYFFSKRTYFQPKNYFILPDTAHIRFWETVDIYQLMLSLPQYKGFDTLLNLGVNHEGTNRKLSSPLQIALELTPGRVKNLVFFPAVPGDKDLYYKDVLVRWNRFTLEGSDLQKNVNGLPGTQNVLAFYTPTFDLAQKLNEELKLTDWNFPILLLVGSVIERDGIVKAFYLPDHRNKTKELQNLSLEKLVEGDGNSEKA